MNIRFFNARILTMADGFDIQMGEVWVKGNMIAYAGGCENSPLKNNEISKVDGKVLWDREIDCQGNLLMPGFKNAHTHSGMTFLRSYADDLPLLEWLEKQVFPMEAKLTGEDICYLSKLAVMEYLTSGITSNFDMYLTPETIVQASVETGFRTVLTSGLNDFTQSLKQLEDSYRKYNNYHELISFQLGFHAEYTTSRNLLEGISQLAHEYHAPVFTHNSESIAEVNGCIERNGMTPTKYLDSLGLFDYGGGGYHCVHMSEEDLCIFKEKGLSVVTNPASNAKLASGIAPINKMMEMGINLAVGTDGPASNNCLDMFREMFLVTALAKLREKDAAVVDGNLVLKMATIGGAKAMGLHGCDTLQEGKLADIIMIDLHQPNMQPLNCISKNIVYSGSKQNVKLTMVNGKILYEDGRFDIGVEPEVIYEKANAVIKLVTSKF